MSNFPGVDILPPDKFSGANRKQSQSELSRVDVLYSSAMVGVGGLDHSTDGTFILLVVG